MTCYRGLVQAVKQNAVTPEMLPHLERTLAEADLDYLSSQIPAAFDETLEGIARITKIVQAMKEFSHPGGKDKSMANLNRAIETTAVVARNVWKPVAELRLQVRPAFANGQMFHRRIQPSDAQFDRQRGSCH